MVILRGDFSLDRPNLNEIIASMYPSHHRYLTEHRESVSSSSGSSICEPSSPMARRPSTTTMEMSLDTEVNPGSPEKPWNLVAYHVPWGPGYEGYESGTLPGPEGTCIFLRSPTPLKRQRTTQACDSCRERKAKCSGTRPSCARCLSRGLQCAYSASTSVDATQYRTPLRRSSHTSLRPPHIKVPMRTRLRRKSSLPETDTGSIQETNSAEFSSHPPASWQGFSTELNGNVSGNSLSLPGDDFESPIEPPISSPWPSNDSAGYPFPGVLRTRASYPGDTLTSLYAQSLSELDGYRFPPEGETKRFTMPQLPLASSSFDTPPPLTEQPSLLRDGPNHNIMWHGFNQAGSRTLSGVSSAESSTNINMTPDSDPAKQSFYSQPVFVQPGLDETLANQYQA